MSYSLCAWLHFIDRDARDRLRFTEFATSSSCDSISLLSPNFKLAVFLCFLAILTFTCYQQPVLNFDRYIYEAILLGRSQPIEVVYSFVKHESPRAESSSVLDSPQHLRELEPLYSIRPVYLAAISTFNRLVPIQNAITLISALSLAGIGLIVFLWTNESLLVVFLMAASPIVSLGRLGTPDALSSLLLILALWVFDVKMSAEKSPGAEWLGISILLLSMGVRTDNAILCLIVFAWLGWRNKIPRMAAAALGSLAIAIVLGLNHWAGNYGWVVLFRYSFIGGRYPAAIPHTLSLRAYLSALAHGIFGITDQISIWILLGILAWIRRPHPLLIIIGITIFWHFLLFPSAEDRYLAWTYIVTGIILIRSLESSEISRKPMVQPAT